MRKSPRNSQIRTAAVALSATAMLLAGCARTLPPPPVLAPESQAPSETYLIGPLDTLEIFVWDTKSTSTRVPVRPDGRISFPLAGDLQAAGLTPTDLAKNVEQALKPFVQEPIVTVVVDSFGDTGGQTIRVVGEAQHPAAVPYRAGMTVLDVMVAVGGLTPYAAGNRAVLVRGRSAATYGLHLGDLLHRGDIAANAPVEPGDIVMIPQSPL
jgi:polysaccharide export outer membrane protein